MAEKKYEKYIITTDDARPKSDPNVVDKFREIRDTIGVPVTYMDSKAIQDNFYMECLWFHTPSDVPVKTHVHDWDEVLGFFGSNPDDYHDLCGEIELWLEDEQYIINKSCLVFVPKGMKHCPLYFRKIDRPIFHFSAGPAGEYIKDNK